MVRFAVRGRIPSEAHHVDISRLTLLCQPFILPEAFQFRHQQPQVLPVNSSIAKGAGFS
jgi:hypothetical protein